MNTQSNTVVAPKLNLLAYDSDLYSNILEAEKDKAQHILMSNIDYLNSHTLPDTVEACIRSVKIFADKNIELYFQYGTKKFTHRYIKTFTEDHPQDCLIDLLNLKDG